MCMYRYMYDNIHMLKKNTYLYIYICNILPSAIATATSTDTFQSSSVLAYSCNPQRLSNPANCN